MQEVPSYHKRLEIQLDQPAKKTNDAFKVKHSRIPKRASSHCSRSWTIVILASHRGEFFNSRGTDRTCLFSRVRLIAVRVACACQTPSCTLINILRLTFAASRF